MYYVQNRRSIYSITKVIHITIKQSDQGCIHVAMVVKCKFENLCHLLSFYILKRFMHRGSIGSDTGNIFIWH